MKEVSIQEIIKPLKVTLIISINGSQFQPAVRMLREEPSYRGVELKRAPPGGWLLLKGGGGGFQTLAVQGSDCGF